MARRSTRILSYLLQRGRNHKARRQVVNWRLFGFMAAEPDLQEQCLPQQITNGTLFKLKPPPHAVHFLENRD
jgi:hypothetical protein